VADRLDVAGRLAEGWPAVERTQKYVRACQALGYQHPDLTSQPAQVRDWYDSEGSLDLRALDKDCSELRAAVAALTEALRTERDQITQLVSAWVGPGGESAVDFLQRHCDSGSAVAAEVRAAAQRCESLRDNLWHLVDVKVATVIDIDDRALAHRPTWLAAADTVTTGVGDRPTADELVRQQIKPYVDNDIREEWVAVMRSTRAGVAACYDMVNDKLAAASPTYFDIPDVLGSGRESLRPVPAVPPAATEAITPAAAAFLTPSRDPAPAASAIGQSPTAQTPPGTASAPADLSASPMGATGPGGLGDLGGAGGAGGLSGLAGRIVDAMGGLLGSAADQLSGLPGLDDSSPGDDLFDDPFDEDEEDGGDDDHDDGHGEVEDDTRAARAEQAKDADEPGDLADGVDAAAPAVPAEAAPPENGGQSPDPPPPAAGPPHDTPPVSAPPANPPPGGSTPCEIAADALPQAGQ